MLCDRYPMPGLYSMEGRHGQRLHRAHGRLARRWIRLEQEAHESIERPTLVIGLRIPAETATVRQPDDGADFVSFRAEEFFSYTEAPDVDIATIDATASPTAVSAQLRTLVWRAL